MQAVSIRLKLNFTAQSFITFAEERDIDNDITTQFVFPCSISHAKEHAY
jgi:hypothetical protein